MAVYVSVPFFEIGAMQFFSEIVEFLGTICINISFFGENTGIDKDKTDVFPKKLKVPYRIRYIIPMRSFLCCS